MNCKVRNGQSNAEPATLIFRRQP